MLRLICKAIVERCRFTVDALRVHWQFFPLYTEPAPRRLRHPAYTPPCWLLLSARIIIVHFLLNNRCVIRVDG